MKIITHITRFLVGAVFIFSGLIKANDPLGFSYKLEEYFEVFHMDFMVPAALFTAIFICVFEVALGCMLLLGARVKLTLWLSMLMIIFFTFLTFYSAYFDVVKECGCFGDFLHMTPWTSFTKDLILLVLLIILFIGRQYINPLFNNSRIENVLLYLVIICSVVFPLYTYNYLPVKDFRAYRIGTDLYKAIHPEVKYFYRLKHKQTGEVKEFDKWPDNWDKDYDYVDNRTEKLDPNVEDIIGFTMNNEYSENYGDEFLMKPGYKFILVAYDLERTNLDAIGKANDLAAMSATDSIEFVGLTSSDSVKTATFITSHSIKYKYYINPDDVPLKTMIRSNPGLMLLKDATVVDMWHYNSFPSYNEVKEKYFKK